MAGPCCSGVTRVRWIFLSLGFGGMVFTGAGLFKSASADLGRQDGMVRFLELPLSDVGEMLFSVEFRRGLLHRAAVLVHVDHNGIGGNDGQFGLVGHGFKTRLVALHGRIIYPQWGQLEPKKNNRKSVVEMTKGPWDNPQKQSN